LESRHAPVDRYSLQASVGNAAFGAAPFDTSGCDDKGRGWKCAVESDPGSGYSDYYVVSVKPNSSCWTAQRLAGKWATGPAHIHGCVTRGDVDDAAGIDVDDSDLIVLMLIGIAWLGLVCLRPLWVVIDKVRRGKAA
jgi:hypothetical protein